ncbi:MAG TPA: AAA family ATPase [Polyangia bacterium]|nr:AAA family ATPase [Polyangia bacterium]
MSSVLDGKLDLAALTPGTLVAERFEVEDRIAGGGGRVFRAQDRVTGARVALKILPGRPSEELFEEFSALGALRHPGIAAPVAFGWISQGHGKAGQAFVATEWVEGENLARRLLRQPLDLSQSLVLMRSVAEALAALHQRGLGHRGIKPSHLLLQGGQIEQVVLLDAGLPLGTLAVRTATFTEEVGGALEYTAPEQARGERRVGPEADVFALGCVLHECLTGAPPFTGRSAAVVLARILCEDAPSLRMLRPEMPESVERLLGQMLAKEPHERLRDGEAVLAALSAVTGALAQRVMVPGPAPPAPLGLEQRLVSILLTTPCMTEEGWVLPDLQGPEGMEERLAACRDELQHLLRPYGGRVDCLATGSILATLAPLGCTAADQAVQSARAALVLQQRLPGSTVALTMGRGVVAGHLALAEVVQQAVDLLLEGEIAAAGEGDRPRIWLDALTAGLLEGRYRVRRTSERPIELEGAWDDPDAPRLLLGRPAPYVGREQELSTLEMLYDACAGDEVARAVLVLAPSGTGKSRLRQELVRRLQRRGERMQVLIGRGDLMRAGTAYGLLSQALLGLWEEEAPAEGPRDLGEAGLRAWFAERVGRHVPRAERSRVVEFLGEMCGFPSPDEPSAQLRAARQEPRLMNLRVAEAWVTFLRAECARAPVLLVLEDLHWSDAATIRLVDVALRELAERPLLVMALARSEVKELFPRLWEGRSVQELHLAGLGRKASERLVYEMLGERATPDVVARLVRQAGGNALFLEELIRAAAEGAGTAAGEALPETVLAMLQARFLRLESGARRVLRAASVFGETFWRGGVQELLGLEEHHGEELDRWLMGLMSGEVIVRQSVSRFPGETQYAFRHQLLRDAAYALLRAEDRMLGHRAAARYLERMGETDGLVLAEHHRRGGLW